MEEILLRKGRPAKRLVELAMRKREPVLVESQPLPIILHALLGNPAAARSISKALNGDIRNIHGWDIRDLEALEGVGPGTIGKIAALLEIIRRVVKKP